ncbi:tetratricopeptide repeat (TPR)-like superfamily protein [Actinidia rufa]|uniref:Tetratricopeptide repeat (TPR)-like superfamily protein n=1 Tax=Actinidia rufa TaxID=165716 RepID=A0A7J0FYI6_9ERIC|nr:tetratricopeptide repeat (TPR)-like superfamily protein [Actinidia rufa]
MEFLEDGVVNENGNSTPIKENPIQNKSPKSPSSPRTATVEAPFNGVVEPSIEQLYDNVCEMQSSDQSPSRASFGSEGEESRIDSELRHLLGGEMREIEIMEEEVEVEKRRDEFHSDSGSKKGNSSTGTKPGKVGTSLSASTKSPSPEESKDASNLQLESLTLNPNGKSPQDKPPVDKRNVKNSRKPNTPKRPRKQNAAEDSSESGLDNLDLGPFLLKQARDLISSGDNPQKALELALRAAKSFEKCANGKPSLDVVMCLHVTTAAIHCSLGQYVEAIPVLEHSIEIPVIEDGQDHALAKFAGHMQLGDTYAMLGQLENSIECYTTGLEVQRQVLGETDPRVGETCRYLAEAHVQALQFHEAEKYCQMALEIHKEKGSPASLDEAADRRLMGLICETKGDHEAALEHLVLASMAMVANGQETEVALVDCSIGDTYLSLTRYDEAVFAYQKALTVFKTSKGENHPAVASVFVRLADLYNKTGKLRESKSYCENALRIYGKPIPGIPPEEIASGLTDISAIYESMNELDQAIKLLQKALKTYNDAPGQQSTIAGIEAQMGVMYYMLGNYAESYTSFKNAISKLRASGEKKSAFFGIALNQMGLACVQCYAINEAADLFEEARIILEQEYGPYHPDTLGVYSNLAGTYDAVGRLPGKGSLYAQVTSGQYPVQRNCDYGKLRSLGKINAIRECYTKLRLDDAIEILERVVGMREEKLGTANPDVDDEKKRLAELLKEAGRVRSRKARSLETLLDANPHAIKKDGIKV